jgi:hypothetical protein
LYLFIGMTGLPPGEFSLTSPGTKIPGQVTSSKEALRFSQRLRTVRIQLPFYMPCIPLATFLSQQS